MYNFHRIQHALILTQSLLVGLTPLIPIPLLDDAVKNVFLRNMARQIAAGRGIALTPAQVEALIQEDFWDSCVEGCVGIIVYILRELLSKIFFFLEWRRSFLLIGQTYYTGFLLDAALLDGYPLAGTGGSTAEAARLREAIRRARYGANYQLIQHLVRSSLRPGALISAAWMLVRRVLVSLPRVLVSIPGALWRSLRSVPGQVASLPRRVRTNITLRIQVLLGKEQAPELRAIQRMAQSMQATLLRMDTAHFDMLHAKLRAELDRPLLQPKSPA